MVSERQTQESGDGGRNAGKALKRLGELKRQVGPLLFERVQLTAGLLKNRQWIDAAHKGDEAAAGDWLLKEHFPDLQDFTGATEIVAIYDRFPTEAQWQEHEYRYAVLVSILREEKKRSRQRNGEGGGRRQGTHNAALIEKQEQQLREFEQRITKQGEALSSKDQIIARLQAENDQLRMQCAELRGQVAALERQMRHMANAE